MTKEEIESLKKKGGDKEDGKKEKETKAGERAKSESDETTEDRV